MMEIMTQDVETKTQGEAVDELRGDNTEGRLLIWLFILGHVGCKNESIEEAQVQVRNQVKGFLEAATTTGENADAIVE